MRPRRYVVVSGPPASGKSTLAPAIAERLGLPLLAKDTIKDALLDVLAPPDPAASSQLSRAAVQAMLALGQESTTGAVLEGNLHRSAVVDRLATLPGRVVEVFCRCDRATAAARFAARAGSRRPGHFDLEQSFDELWANDVTDPVAGGWPVIEVDTETLVDIESLIDAVQRHFGT